MKILLYKDFIIAFLFKKFENEEYKKSIKNIFYNDNHIFLYSKKFFQYLKEEIEDEELYEALVKKLSDNGENVKSSDNSNSFNDEFLSIYNTAQDNIIIGFSYLNEELIGSIPKLVILSKQQKTNYHWIVVQLAICHPYTLTLMESDFRDDKEINDFFYSIFTIPRKNYKVKIFDDYCNFNHDKFRFLKEKNITVYYHTSKESRKKFNSMKRLSSSFDMYIKKNETNAHERQINFEGFIITPTHDFQCLKVHNHQSKWSIHVQYNESEYKKSISYITNKYEKITA
jgi:hypothetical protein